jgi:probable rRNA maturation factor
MRRLPKLNLAVQGRARFAGLPARGTLGRWIAAALECDAEITLRFVDAREGRRLNREYRGKDVATDVLTFEYAHRPAVRADIVICPSVAWRGARERRRSRRAHLAHLVIHGVLHGHGLDHANAEAAIQMEEREIAILAQLGFDNPYLIEPAQRLARK